MNNLNIWLLNIFDLCKYIIHIYYCIHYIIKLIDYEYMRKYNKFKCSQRNN